MSQTCLSESENSMDHFFTFAELPPCQLALSWRCPWHIGKLEIPGCHPQQWFVLAQTQKTVRSSYHCWARIHSRVQKLPLPLLDQFSILLVLMTSSFQVLVLKLSCCGFELLPTHPRSSNTGKAPGVHFPTNKSDFLLSKRKPCKPGTTEFLSPIHPRNTLNLLWFFSLFFSSPLALLSWLTSTRNP